MVRLCFLLIALGWIGTATAKLRLYPVQPDYKIKPGLQVRPAWRKADGSLSLPFWDDFSTYEGEPDTSLWMPGSGVYVNKTRALNPPTLGVATFDGATAQGGLYNTDPDAIGLADTLESRPIGLGSLATTEVNSVYLSFFWEFEGLQEPPDTEDSLILLFKNQNGEWVRIDAFISTEVTSSDTFEQVIYQLKPEFLYNDFQFKLEEYGRLSGPYDAWHIDYVYLNKGRQVNDKTYFDRAISTTPTLLFNGYSALPVKEFFTDPAKYISKSSVSIYNLDKIFQPIEYSAIVRNTFDHSQIIDTLNYNTALNPILQGQQRRTLTANALNPDRLNRNLDSIYMNLEFYISSGDSIRPDGIDYRLNDTITSDFVLHDYLAYDDGTAEFGAGLDQNIGKVAYMFILDRPANLDRVDISFINIGRDETNTPFNLYIWKKLSSKASDIIYEREGQSVDPISGFNTFQSIRLPETAVSDTFYIGWEQLTSDFLVVGLDKNNNTGNRIFFNVTGDWQPNIDIKGSLMIRPYFSPEDVPVGLPAEGPETEVKIYPNPASTELNIRGAVQEMELLNISGQPVGRWEGSPYPLVIDVSRYSPGMYILTYRNQYGIKSRKILIQH